MRPTRRTRDSDEAAPDLTPLIDVTFQLIIFFMLVSQITSREHVVLRLPDARAANPEDPRDKPLFIVHIAPLEQVRQAQHFGWYCHGESTPRGRDEMRAILAEQAARIDPEIGYAGQGADGISENTILVRCDARCPAREFGSLLELMAIVKLYKVKIAIRQEQELN